MAQTILENTISLLQSCKGDWVKVSAETGLDYNWITSVALGRIKNPGIINIEKLHDYLMQKYGKAA